MLALSINTPMGYRHTQSTEDPKLLPFKTLYVCMYVKKKYIGAIVYINKI